MIRLATLKDIPEIVDCLQQFHLSTNFSNFNFNPDKAAKVTEALIQNPQTGVALVAENNSEITGILGGIISDALYSDTRVAAELAWWTHPEKSKPWDGTRLQQAYEYWAKYIAKAQFISLGVLEGPRASRLAKIHSKRGYIKKEETWLQELY